MNTGKKLLLVLFFYLFSIGLASAIQLNPNPVNFGKNYNILAHVDYLISLEPVLDANVTYNITNGTSADCTAQNYPISQKLNWVSNDTYCTGSGCAVGIDDPAAPLATGLYTVCVNASKPGYSSSYSSYVLNVSVTNCGNGVIDSGENCNTCPADAGCTYGLQCCGDGTCKSSCSPVPGCNNNGVCEPFETCNCADCSNIQDGCIPGDICNGYSTQCACTQGIDGICPISDLACAFQDPDCAANLTSIYLSGDTNILSIYWNGSAMSRPPATVNLQCFLNCDPENSLCGPAPCTQNVSSSSGACQIFNPIYSYQNYNTAKCRVSDPSSNRTYGYLNYSFKPYDVDIGVSSFSVTVGQSFVLPVTIRNIGLFTDSYTVNITPNNLVYIQTLSQTTTTLAGVPLINSYSVPFNMRILAIPTNPSYIALTIMANSTTNPSYGKAVFIQLKSGTSSLPEYGFVGVLQIFFFSSLILAFLISRKK